MKLKKVFLFIAVIPLTISCAHFYEFEKMGDLSMAATRNIDNSKEYIELKSYAGISSDDVEAAIATSKKGKIKKRNPIVKEVNILKATNLQDAIDKVVKGTAGGDYLYNVKLYSVTEYKGFKLKEIDHSYVVSGDVWGIHDGNSNIRGYRLNDIVAFTYNAGLRNEIGTKNFKGENGKQYRGTVVGLKGSYATILLENETVVDIPYSYLIKINQ